MIFPELFSKHIENKVTDKKETIYRTVVNDTETNLEVRRYLF